MAHASFAKGIEMIRSSIDIGTNSVLLLVAEVNNGELKVLEELLEVPRLGKGVDKNKTLDDDSIQRVLDVLEKYQKFLEANYKESVSNTVVTATSAVRDSSNREEFMRLVKAKTGWGILLLSGDEEAITTYRGALTVLDHKYHNTANAILDIGGGSTEIALGNGLELEEYVSLDMGSVRFSERFFKTHPPDKYSITELKDEVKSLLNSSELSPDHIETAIGVAGTVTSVAAIELNMDEYEVSKLNNYPLKLKTIYKFIDQFSVMSAKEMENRYPIFLKNRGDVILGGLLILSGFLEWAGKDEIIVSTGGIRHGVLI